MQVASHPPPQSYITQGAAMQDALVAAAVSPAFAERLRLEAANEDSAAVDTSGLG